MSIRKWLVVGFFGAVAAGTAVTAIQTNFGEAHWGQAQASTYPPHHDTAWYFHHPVERQQVIHWCTLDSRAAEARKWDCENAIAASNPYWGR
jgi:hypothetical protein